MSSDVDVTVIGGGPAGAACALILQDEGVRTKLVSRATFRSRPAELLAPTTVRSLRRLGLTLTELVPGATACPKSATSWLTSEPDIFDYTLFMREPGYAVNRAALDQAMVAAAKSRGVDCMDATLNDFRRERSNWQLSAGGHRWTSRYLVDASGKQGAMPASKDRRHSDRLVAVYSPWKTTLIQPWLSIEATCSGWWYVMPSSDEASCVAFMTDFDLVPSDRATRSTWLHEKFLRTKCIQHLSKDLPNFRIHRATDARSSRARQFSDDGLIILGDAAWANDPLSGRGIALAIEQAKQASAAICGGLKDRPGDSGSLAAYQDWCESEYARAEHARVQTYTAAKSRFSQQEFWWRRAGDRASEHISLPDSDVPNL